MYSDCSSARKNRDKLVAIAHSDLGQLQQARSLENQFDSTGWISLNNGFRLANQLKFRRLACRPDRDGAPNSTPEHWKVAR